MNNPAMKLTAEQSAIVARARDTSDPLAIVARAGGAKTTTLVEIAKALPSQSLLALAFNKKIAVEMSQRLPDNADSRTLNALGNTAWKEFLGTWPKLVKSKSYDILSGLIERLDAEEKEEAYEFMAETLKVLRQAKTEGYVPEGANRLIRGIISEDDFFGELDEIPSDLQRDLVNRALITSIKLAFEGHIDFDDQIYMSTLVKSCSFPTYDVVLIDEAQDLSALNHLMLKKIVKRGRLIAVGDPAQAIYGFRGADENSMENLAQMFGLSEMNLTICFRCAPEVVENARWRAPDMQPWKDTPAGTVTRHAQWSLSDIEDGDAIICRNNAPLFRLAIALLREKRSPELVSGDIIPGLVKIMTKFAPSKKNGGAAAMPRDEALTELARWREAELNRSRRAATVEDKAECIRCFIEQTDNLAEAIAMLEEIAVMTGRVKLMTGHKSKGLEFDNVWFLDQFLCNVKKNAQDRNVRYVIETRARRNLHYIETEKMV